MPRFRARACSPTFDSTSPDSLRAATPGTSSRPHLLYCFFGYEPCIDNERNVTALRVRLEPSTGMRPGVAQLYAEFAQDCPAHSKPILLSAPAAMPVEPPALKASIADDAKTISSTTSA